MALHAAVPTGGWPELGPPAGLRGISRQPVPLLNDVRPGISDIANAIVLPEPGARLDAPAGPPLANPPAANIVAGRKWSWALAASGLFHAAVAALLIVAGSTAILIEGADDAGIAMLGDAANDELQAGGPAEPDVTQVTIIAMLPARQVATVDAETVTIEAAESAPVTAAASEVVEAAPPDAIHPVEEAVIAPIEEPAAVPVPAEESRPAPDAATAPEVLTAETIDPAEDNTVAPQVETQAIDQVETAQALPAEPSPVLAPIEEPQATRETTVPSVQPMQPDAVQGIETVEAEEAPAAEAETIVAAEEPDLTVPLPHEAPIPEPRRPEQERMAEAPKAEPRKPEPKKAEARPARQQKTEKAERAEKKERESASGAEGNGRANAKKGVADGEQNGKTTARSRGGKSGVGNAAVSNYPGKVASKLRRAARSISRSAVRKARNDVQVGFTVRADGSVGGIRITRSSGSPELDRAALAVVQRAAPFPPIPEGAGRSSWAFALPLGVAR